MEIRNVVTSFLEARGKILLLRRSSKVGTYQGRWAAVSGYLEEDEPPLDRARTEIREEIGFRDEQFSLIRAGRTLRALDEASMVVWVIHPFLFRANTETIHLDWEHTELKWVTPDELNSFQTVPKLREALERVRWELNVFPDGFQSVLNGINEISNDRIHGASFLGRRALEVLRDAAQAIRGGSPADFFQIVLAATFKLRGAQPSMATIYNLTGKLLYRMQQRVSGSESIEDYRIFVIESINSLLAQATQAAEDAARNAVAIFPDDGVILTHSYSSSVRRALELGRMSGKKFEVYLTESYPGFEGRQLAKDLIAGNVPVKLIPDSTAPSTIPQAKLVVVGADSVMPDGSVINKVGTRALAASAFTAHLPFYVVTETAKFSVSSFLGEPITYSNAIFDHTPGNHVAGLVTENGSLRAVGVEPEIRWMLRELYV